MNGNLNISDDIPKGYLSEADKRKFTITAGVLGALFFFGQMILPFFAMLIFMPLFFSSMFKMKYADMKRAVFWKNHIWYIEETGTPESYHRGLKYLMKIDPLKDRKASKADSLSFENPWLLPKNDTLWIISSESVGYYWEGKTTQIIENKRLGNISKPFVYNGNITVLETQPSGFFLRSYKKGSWMKPTQIHLMSFETDSTFLEDLQFISTDKKVFLFIKFKDVIFFSEGVPLEKQVIYESWTPITNAERWTVISHGDNPILFVTYSKGYKDKLFALRKINGEWKSFMSHEISFPMFNTGFLSFSDDDKFFMLNYSYNGQLQISILTEEKIEAIIKRGRNFPFPSSFMLIMIIPYSGQLLLPLILALILSVQMKKHRISKYESREKQAVFAPLSLRVFSQIVDVFILSIPFIIWFIFFIAGFVKLNFFESVFFSFAMFGTIILGFIWWILGIVIYSYTEGKWGITPGKYFFKIRVIGSDLKPCGFGRAIIRNLLKSVDGFFNFMVGIMLIALTTNWQRVGDLAARTIVIRKPRRQDYKESG